MGGEATRAPLYPSTGAELEEGPLCAVKKKSPQRKWGREALGRAFFSPFFCRGPALSLGVGGAAGLPLLGERFARKSPVAFADNAAGISRAIALLLRNGIF